MRNRRRRPGDRRRAPLLRDGAPGAVERGLRARLARLSKAGLERSTALPRGHPVSFCSNDYLGLARHPAVLRAAARFRPGEGWGSTGSRLVSGTSASHLDLERALAEFHRRPGALLFPTGYQANVGTISALAEPGDLLLSDALNHASLIDGCRLSGAEVRIYRHADPDHLAALLRGARRRRVWIVTDAVFSVDGDLAPLRELAGLAARSGAGLIVDEAHAVGVFGPGGRGLAAGEAVSEGIHVLVGTLSKALGGIGGWVSGSESLVRLLRSRARSFLFSTAAPPAAARAGLAALEVCLSPDGDRRRARLWANVRALRAGLPGASGASPILPLSFRGVRRAGEASARLLERGFHVPPLRPPTVPPGTSRLRIVASAEHTPARVRAFLGALQESL